MISEKELAAIVSLCWRVASHAEMEDQGDGMLTDPDEKGQRNFRSARYETYFRLLSNLIPNVSEVKQSGTFDATMHDPKEAWQE